MHNCLTTFWKYFETLNSIDCFQVPNSIEYISTSVSIYRYVNNFHVLDKYSIDSCINQAPKHSNVGGCLCDIVPKINSVCRAEVKLNYASFLQLKG